MTRREGRIHERTGRTGSVGAPDPPRLRGNGKEEILYTPSPGVPWSDLFYNRDREDRYPRARRERPFFDYADTSYSAELILEKYFGSASPKEADILALNIPSVRPVTVPGLPKFDHYDFQSLVLELLESGVEPKAITASQLWKTAPKAWHSPTRSYLRFPRVCDIFRTLRESEASR